MKKLMTLVLAVCMLLTAALAFAEAPVLQDEKAPAILGAVTVYDAVGQVVRSITDHDEIEHLCITARDDDHDIMNKAADCNFAALGYIANEKFAFFVEDAALVEATFALHDWQNVDAVYATADGINWVSAESTVNADNTITVKSIPGVVVFVCASGEGGEVLPTAVDMIDNDNFMPSVSAKPAPVMVSCAIVDANGTVVKDTEKGIRVEITPAASRHYTKDINIYENLNTSYEEILEAESLADLGLIGVEGMTVRDLFEVTLYGDSLHYGLFNLEVTFEADAPEAVAIKGDDGWKLVGTANIVDNGNGTVTLTLSETGTVAFLVTVAGQNAVNSPAT